MRVLYITNYDTMYGANKALYEMMCILKEEYHVEPYLLVPGMGGGIIGGMSLEKGIPVLTYDFRISAVDEDIKWKPLRKFTRRVMRYYDFYHIWKDIRKKDVKFDIIHSNSSVFDIGFFLSQKLHSAHIWHIREFAKEGCGLEIVMGKHSLQRKYRKSQAVVTISKAMEEFYRKKYKHIPIRHIYDGVELSHSYHKKYLYDNVLNFCIVGTINRKKNVLDILKACSKLCEAGVENYRVYIVGGAEEDYYEELQAYIRQNDKIKKHIIFYGYCNEINRFLQTMDVGIIASESEGFGRVTVEYMANYMPVIGTDVAATNELLKGVGNLFAVHDIDALAASMKKYIDNVQLLQKIGKKSRERAEFFSDKRNAHEIYSLYQEIVGVVD